MVQAATKPQPFAGRSDLQDYLTKGYVASDISTRGCSETLEYAYDDWALGNFAAALGKNADADVFYSRSKNYKNVWYNPEKHMCARLRDGTWNCPPTWLNVFDERYVEGDGEHCS
jgi:putative alpha-1,2-mannosidase